VVKPGRAREEPNHDHWRDRGHYYIGQSSNYWTRANIATIMRLTWFQVEEQNTVYTRQCRKFILGHGGCNSKPDNKLSMNTGMSGLIILTMDQRLTVAQQDSPGSSVFDLPAAVTHLDTFTAAELLERVPVSISDPEHDLAQVPNEPSFLIISGGTGGNAICSAFTNACYVLPVSDDGGSSSEIIRVLGGPSIGTSRACHSPVGTLCLRWFLENCRRHKVKAHSPHPTSTADLYIGCNSSFTGLPFTH